MAQRTLAQKILLIIFTLLILAATFAGSQNFDEIFAPLTLGQLITQLCVMTYTILGPFLVFGLWTKKQWTFTLMIAWAAACTSAAGLASRFYGEQTWLIVAVSAASVLICVVPIVWYSKVLIAKTRSDNN